MVGVGAGGVGARGGEGGEPRHGGKRLTDLWKEDAGMDVGPDALAKGQSEGPPQIRMCTHRCHPGTVQEVGLEAPGISHSTHAATLPSPKPEHLPLADRGKPEAHMPISLSLY